MWHKAITPHNIITSFKATGICLFNRAVINLKKGDSFSSFHLESLAQRTGLAYIPLYSPSRIHKHPLDESSRYTYQYPSSPVSSCSPPTSQLLSPTPPSLSNSESNSARLPLRQATSISNFLLPNIPPSELLTKHTKSAGKVLTSMENLQLIEEQQKKKEGEAQKKEERKRKREEKARLEQEQMIAKKKKKR